MNKPLNYSELHKQQSVTEQLGGTVEPPSVVPEHQEDPPTSFPFDPEASYDSIRPAPVVISARPENVPPLFLEVIPPYETSSEEDEDE